MVHPEDVHNLFDRQHGGTVGNPSHFVNFRKRLDAALPVTILAVGSSLVATHAGCTQKAPSARGPACRNTPCGTVCGGSTHGWARQVLEWLNSTWPHPGHSLVNLGEAGGSLVSALTTCPSTYLNFDVDLALVDLTTTSVPDGERLLRLLLRRRGRPTLPLLTQFHPFVVEERPWRAEKHRAAPGQPEPVSVTEVGGGDSCVDGRLSNRTKSDVAWDANRRPFLKALSACADAGGHGALNRYISASTPVDALGRCADSMGGTLLWWGKQTRGHRAVAEHYRLPVFTTLGAWARAFERGDGNLSACSFTESDQGGDSMHPNRNEFSTRLVSTPLIDLLKRGLHRAQNAAPPQPLPPPLQLANANPPALSRCYDFTDDESPAHFGGMQGVRPQGLRLTGWRHVEKERASDKYKPGLLATDAGATLAFELDLAGYRSPRLDLQHLASWRGVGRVGVSCSGGCSCGKERVVSGRSQLRHTKLETSTVPLVCGAACDGGGPACAIELRLLHELCVADEARRRRLAAVPRGVRLVNRSCAEHRFKLVRALLHDEGAT